MEAIIDKILDQAVSALGVAVYWMYSRLKRALSDLDSAHEKIREIESKLKK